MTLTPGIAVHILFPISGVFEPLLPKLNQVVFPTKPYQTLSILMADQKTLLKSLTNNVVLQVGTSDPNMSWITLD